MTFEDAVRIVEKCESERDKLIKLRDLLIKGANNYEQVLESEDKKKLFIQRYKMYSKYRDDLSYIRSRLSYYLRKPKSERYDEYCDILNRASTLFDEIGEGIYKNKDFTFGYNQITGEAKKKKFGGANEKHKISMKDQNKIASDAAKKEQAAIERINGGSWSQADDADSSINDSRIIRKAVTESIRHFLRNRII